VGLGILDRAGPRKEETGMSKEDVVREVSYPDHVHIKYPPAFSERFSNHVKTASGESARRWTEASGHDECSPSRREG